MFRCGKSATTVKQRWRQICNGVVMEMVLQQLDRTTSIVGDIVKNVGDKDTMHEMLYDEEKFIIIL